MPANTTRGYPYPLPTEPVAEGAQAIRNLAEAVDGKEAIVRLFDVNLAAPAANIDLTSIPQTYSHLRLYLMLKSTDAAALVVANMQMNGITTALYHSQQLSGAAGTPGATGLVGTTVGKLGNVSGGTLLASNLCPVTVDFLHYRDANVNYRPWISHWFRLSGGTVATDIDTGQMGGMLNLGAAINRITILPGAGQWAANCRATLYGLR